MIKFNPPSKKIESSVVNNVSLLFIFVSLPWVIIFYFLDQPFLALSVIPFSGLFGLSFFLNKKKQTSSKHLLLLTGTIALIFYSVLLGEAANVQLIYFPLFVSTFILFATKEKTNIFVWSSIFLISYIGIELVFSFNLFLPLYLSDVAALIIRLLMTFIAIFLLFAEIITFITKIIQLYEQNEYYKIKILAQQFQLTTRELDIINHLIRGKTNREISYSLFISESTVKTHLKQIFKKTKVSNRSSLISLVLQTH